MITFIKVLLLLAALFLVFYPIIPWESRQKKFSSIAALRYKKEHVRVNGFFILLAILELILFVLLYNLLAKLGNTIAGIPFISSILGGTSNSFDFRVFAVMVLIINVLSVYFYVILKTILKKFLDGFVYTDEELEQMRQEKNRSKKKSKNHNQKKL